MESPINQQLQPGLDRKDQNRSPGTQVIISRLIWFRDTIAFLGFLARTVAISVLILYYMKEIAAATLNHCNDRSLRLSLIIGAEEAILRFGSRIN